MSDFLDFDQLDLSVKEQTEGVRAHPLKDKLSMQFKFAYVGGLVFGALADDSELQKEEKSKVVATGTSLGLSLADINETIEQTMAISDKIGFIKETASLLKERETILFFILDLVLVMSADGMLSDNALKLVSAFERLAAVQPADAIMLDKAREIVIKKSGWSDAELDYKMCSDDDEVAKKWWEWFQPAGYGSAIVRKGMESVRAELNAASRDIRRTLLHSKIHMALSNFKFSISNSRCYFGDNAIPASKRAKARTSMRVLEDEHLFQMDITLFGGADDGIVVTDRAIYFKESFQEPVRIPWKDLKRVSYGGMYIYFDGYGKIGCTIGDNNAVAAVANALQGLVNDFQSDPSQLDVE